MTAARFSLQQIGVSIFEWLERFTAGKYWRLKIALVATCLSLAVSFPKTDWLLSIHGFQFSEASLTKYEHLRTPFNWGHWKSFELQRDHPFVQQEVTEDTHEAKRALRLAVPLFARFFGLSDFALCWILSIFGISFFYFAIRCVERVSSDRVTAALFALSVAPLMCAYANFFPLGAKFDGVAFTGLMMAMGSSFLPLICFGIQVACWTDERAILACLIVGVYWLLAGSYREGDEQRRWRISPQAWTVAISLVVYVAMRLYVQRVTGLHTPTGKGSGVQFETAARMGELYFAGLWSPLRASWVVVLVMAAFHLRTKQFLALGIALLAAVPNLLGSYIVYDVSRSAAYVFPLLCIAAVEVVRSSPKLEMRWLLLGTLAVNLISTPLHMVAGAIPVRWPYGLIFVADQPVFSRIIEYFYYVYGQ